MILTLYKARGDMLSLVDKRAIFCCLGCLMKEPSLLSSEKYKLTKDDFRVKGESPFYVIIFAAINNLFNENNEHIDVFSIDSFLSGYSKQYAIFNDNNGIDYLHSSIEQAHIGNFDYYYTRLKKFSLLRDYVEKGFCIKEIYDEDLIEPKEQEIMMQKFESMSIQDIIDHFEAKQVDIRDKYLTDTDSETIHASKDARKLVQKFKEKPDYGISLIGNIQNAIFRGAKLNKLVLRSAPSNLGKTRIALAEAVDMAIDEIYDLKKEEWVYNNQGENVLFITTEMEGESLQPTILAYISGVPEDSIRDAITTEKEDERIEKAIQILERSNLWIEYIPNFDTQIIETKIKQHILNNNAQYIYFDYLHLSLSILEEIANSSKGMRMREDMVLFMFMNRLDQMRKKYNVHIRTATQVNGDWKTTKDADSTVLRGSKALADKATAGIVALSPTKADLEAIEPILRQHFYPEPNVVYHIYKNRETKYKDVKLWLHINYDTMRMTELFLTTNDYKPISIQPKKIVTKQFDF
ncbi:DnaB-like helicase C-terminal domain-containing protein [Paenibacillus dendritiformis]|uniref:DnaB-like helicase C-terminal domain-containing protein n=1 Tax=Paenibacillus dendritiformis TaxID=130049 RepID=UPI00387E18FB